MLSVGRGCWSVQAAGKLNYTMIKAFNFSEICQMEPLKFEITVYNVVMQSASTTYSISSWSTTYTEGKLLVHCRMCIFVYISAKPIQKIQQAVGNGTFMIGLEVNMKSVSIRTLVSLLKQLNARVAKLWLYYYSHHKMCFSHLTPINYLIPACNIKCDDENLPST